ncbi:transposase-like protein [Catenulispora sp. MAP12-49]|uniref:transposase n=1 Tax=Catenulispora sp. MAP12-49 TaxID=3156302 RepID=UPI00351376E9
MAEPRKYPDELRDLAVRLVQESGRPTAHVADDLGVHREALRGCVRQAAADRGQRPDLLSTTEYEELKRLRQQDLDGRRAEPHRLAVRGRRGRDVGGDKADPRRIGTRGVVLRGDSQAIRTSGQITHSYALAVVSTGHEREFASKSRHSKFSVFDGHDWRPTKMPWPA